MPRAGLNTADVVSAGADLLDRGEALTITALAGQLGVKAPSLYKHVDSIEDLHRRIALLAMEELGETIRDALQGLSRAAAMSALFDAVRAYIAAHPGRYAATTNARLAGPDDPLRASAGRVIASVRAALAGYGIANQHLDHAVRMIRCLIQGYAALQTADAFQWTNDVDQSIDWMIAFLDTGFGAVAQTAAPAATELKEKQ